MPLFGQVIIGPPGSGKTTYCNEMSKYLKEMGRRVAIINIGESYVLTCYNSTFLCNLKLFII